MRDVALMLKISTVVVVSLFTSFEILVEYVSDGITCELFVQVSGDSWLSVLASINSLFWQAQIVVVSFLVCNRPKFWVENV